MGVSRDRLEGFRKGRTGTLGRIGEEQSEISLVMRKDRYGT